MLSRRVLIIEDDADAAGVLEAYLRRENYDVVITGDGLSGLDMAHRWKPDLILLDVMLPGMSGMEVCRKLREVSSVPIIMLTAKDSELDKVLGLELGADDYVTKPYSARELIARIRAVLRRRSAETDSATESVLQGGPVRMDIDRHVVTVNGEEISMPLKEFELLEILLRNVGRVMTRGQLIERVWGAVYVGDTKTLDVHIKRLRSKIEPDSSAPQYVVTVRGLGYKFEA